MTLHDIELRQAVTACYDTDRTRVSTRCPRRPGEISRRHLRELEKAGIEAAIFDQDGRGIVAGHAVEILEVTKLREAMGEKSAAVDAVEGKNLVPQVIAEAFGSFCPERWRLRRA
jgi:hypothetical protein